MHRYLGWIGLVLLAATPLQAQVPVSVTAGAARYLTPAGWVPVVPGSAVPLDAYVHTDPGTTAALTPASGAVPLPPDAYFYLDDALPRTRVDLVSALTRIEVSQLPRTDTVRAAPRPLGLIYGKPPAAGAAPPAPYEAARRHAVVWFYEQGRYDAALLALKRFLVRFPHYYADETVVARLLELYERLALYGHLWDETSRLMVVPVSESYDRMVHRFNDVARTRLAGEQ